VEAGAGATTSATTTSTSSTEPPPLLAAAAAVLQLLCTWLEVDPGLRHTLLAGQQQQQQQGALSSPRGLLEVVGALLGAPCCQLGALRLLRQVAGYGAGRAALAGAVAAGRLSLLSQVRGGAEALGERWGLSGCAWGVLCG
jgi:hypothetical protein